MQSWTTFKLLASRGRYFPASFIEPAPSGARIENENEARLALAHMLEGMGRLPQMDQSLLPAIAYEDAIFWTEIPLLAQAGANAAIFPVLLGIIARQEIRIEPGWLGTKARDAVCLALALAAPGRGFVLIRRQASPPCGIEGASLGLSLAVGGARLSGGKKWPGGIAMTGSLTPDGNLARTEFIAAKYHAAKNNGRARIFLYPAENRDEMPVDGNDAFPIYSLAGAIAVCELIEKMEDPGEWLRQLRQWRISPALFFAWLEKANHNFDDLDVILGVAETENWRNKISDPIEFANAVDCLWNWRMKNPDCPCDLASRAASLLENGPLDAIDPLRRMRLANMRMTLESHRGVPCDALWEISRTCREIIANDSALASEEALMAVVRDTIMPAHNAWRFNDPLPGDWLDLVRERRAYCRRVKHDNTLGKIYGALTHHAAFARNWEKALEYAFVSLEYFKNPCDRRRRWLDIAYIHCEMGNIGKALKALEEAAGARMRLAVESADPFFHAAFLRLCLLDPGLFQGYPVVGIFEEFARKAMRHPWQCWAANCGRLLAGVDADLARSLLRFGIEMCLANPTEIAIKPMALPPLGVLMRLDPQNPGYARRMTRLSLDMIRRACREGLLDEAHFKRILEAREELAVLDLVEKFLPDFFPFNYR